MTPEIVPASILHVKPMAARMRAAACATLQSFGFEPRMALRRAFLRSLMARTALMDGKPVAMWGVQGNLLDDTALVWLVMADDIANIPRTIVREARRELKSIMENYEEAATTVLPDDEAAIRFAVYLGFHDRHDDDEPASRKDIERSIRENPRNKIPIGDSFVIGLGYHPEH